MPANTIFSTLTTPPIRLANGRLDTRPDYRGGVAPGVGETPVDPVGVLFSDSFDGQADWNSGVNGGLSEQVASAGYTLPTDWTAVRQTKRWSPSTGEVDRHHVLELNDASTTENPNRAFGGTGKSLVKWRENYGSGNGEWHSDGILLKHIGERSEVYVELMLNLSNECVSSFYAGDFGTTKVLRILSHDDPLNASYSNYWTFFNTYNKPICIFDIGGSPTYGIRNKISFYRYGDGTPLPNISDTMAGFPSTRRFASNGDYEGSFSEAGRDGPMTDYKSGGLITNSYIDIDQVYGDETQWVKVALYVKMSSAPGVNDGEFMQFIDDRRILHFRNIGWIPSHAPMRQWNIISLGGNDSFVGRDLALRHEEWLAFDNVVVRDSLPQRLI
jgi:hypothetical protein